MTILLGVVSKWDTYHGYYNKEIKYLNYFRKKYMYHFPITLDEFYDHKFIYSLKKQKIYKIVLIDGLYRYHKRYFAKINLSIEKFQKIFKLLYIKRKVFQKLKKNRLLAEFIRYIYNPMNGPEYLTLKKKYSLSFIHSS